MNFSMQTVAAGDSGALGRVIRRRGDPGLAKKLEAAPLEVLVPRIAVVDDDEAIHLFLKDLGGTGHFTVPVSCFNAAQAMERLPWAQSDLVIMDIRLPDRSGIECAAKLKTILPDLSIIVLTGYADSRNFFRSLMAGAQGFLVKPVTAQEFLDAIGNVLKGEFVLAKEVIPFLIQLVRQVGQVAREESLTSREEETLACLFQGMPDKEIASALGIGTATVHSHMQRLFQKLGVHSRRDLIAKYLAP